MPKTEITINLPKRMLSTIQKVSKKQGETIEEVIKSVLEIYLPIYDEELNKELEAWDKLSDEALLNFEKQVKG